MNLIILVASVLVTIAQAQHYNYYNNYNNNKNGNYNSYQHNPYDSRYFKHGNKRNEYEGGTCREFIDINARQQCCLNRDDDCYMIHYDSRCYCDVFCDRSAFPDNSDCCPDAHLVCRSGPAPPPTPPTTTQRTRPPAQLDCYKDGRYIRNGESLKDNCNDCYCQNGRLECSKQSCLINSNLLNQINNDPRSTWQAGNYSMFWGKTLEYGYRHRLGTRVVRQTQRPIIIDPQPIQAEYDFRQEPFMEEIVRRPDYIRDQGDCAASWAFSALDVATDRIAKVYEGKRGNESSSAQMIISCAILPGNANGCSPATMDIGWRYIESSNKDSDGKPTGGIVTEKCYPYESGSTGKAAECKINSNANRIICPSDNRPFNKPLLNSGPGYYVRAASSNDIMEEIKENGPVQMGFKVFDDFFMYKSGIYSKHPSAKVANVEDPYHSVKVLGWGSENGVDYWLAANSWGPQWGENGYVRIKRQDDETEFGHYAYAAWGSRSINTMSGKNQLNKKYRQRNVHRRE